MTIYVATISHRHGMNILIENSRKKLDKEIYEYVSENWSELNEGPEMPRDAQDAISHYFESVGDEYLEEHKKVLKHKCVRCGMLA